MGLRPRSSPTQRKNRAIGVGYLVPEFSVPRALSFALLRQSVLDLIKFRAADFERENARKVSGGLEPSGLRRKLRRVPDRFAGRRVGHGLQRNACECTAGHRNEFY